MKEMNWGHGIGIRISVMVCTFSLVFFSSVAGHRATQLGPFMVSQASTQVLPDGLDIMNLLDRVFPYLVGQIVRAHV